MLSHIHITNFAIIDELDLDLHDGLTVITGETGAGKSIMIDAIGLVLGDRADAGVVKHGADKAEISLTIATQDKKVLQWLAENDLEGEEQLILRRVITAEGRSRSYINGSPTTLSILRKVGEQLVDIHGQHAHQSLRDLSSQRQLLDDYAHLGSDTQKLALHYQSWKKANDALSCALSGDGERRDRIDLLRFQAGELEELALEEGELAILDDELNLLANADEISATCASALEQLYEDDDNALYRKLSLVQQQVHLASQTDPRFKNAATLLESSAIQIEEAVGELRELSHSIESNPQRLSQIENRIGQATSLARKHRIDPQTLPHYLQSLQDELAQLEGPESDIESLEFNVKEEAESYDKLAQKLHEKHKKAAKALNKEITAAMQRLGMDGGTFVAAVELHDDQKRYPHGIDAIQFLVSANPGQPPQAINKVASGGELSRIGLSIQLAASKQSLIPTLIFDEVDSGIGGAIAEVVGEHLQRLSQHCQIFCVTHLPQVASFGKRHLLVAKEKTAKATQTRMKAVLDESRTEEIARMLGGKSLSPESLAHARKMLKSTELES